MLTETVIKGLAANAHAVLLCLIASSAGSTFAYPAEGLLEQAEIRLLERDYQKALELYQAVIDSPSASVNEKAEAQNGIGEVYLSQEMFLPAVENFRRAIIDYPGAAPEISAATRRKLGGLYLQTKAYPRAIEELKKALAYYPEVDLNFVGRCQVDLAECYLLQKRYRRLGQTDWN